LPIPWSFAISLVILAIGLATSMVAATVLMHRGARAS
jgi:hypothetical protein